MKYIYLIIALPCLIILSACNENAEGDLNGGWINTNKQCIEFCSFKIDKKINTYSDYYVSFDEMSYPHSNNGPLDKIDEERYIIKANGGDALIRLKDKKVYFTNGSVYEKNEFAYQEYQKKIPNLIRYKAEQEAKENAYRAREIAAQEARKRAEQKAKEGAI